MSKGQTPEELDRRLSWLVGQSVSLSCRDLAEVGKYVLNKLNLAYINVKTNLLC